MFKHGLDRRAASYTWTSGVLFYYCWAVVYLIGDSLRLCAGAAVCLSAAAIGLLFEIAGLPGRSRAPALAIVYISLVGLLNCSRNAVGSRVVLQANALAMRIPELLSRLEKPVELIASPSLPTFMETVIPTLQKLLV